MSVSRSPAELILIIGPPGAGKSTYARKHYPHHLQPDLEAFMRSMRADGELRYTPSVKATAIRLWGLAVDELLSRGLPVCVTSPGETAALRHGWLRRARTHGVPVRVVRLVVDAPTCLRRALADPLRPHTTRGHWRSIIDHWFERYAADGGVQPDAEGISHYGEIPNGDSIGEQLAGMTPELWKKLRASEHRAWLSLACGRRSNHWIGAHIGHDPHTIPLLVGKHGLAPSLTQGMVTARVAARVLGCTPQNASRLCRAGKLKGRRNPQRRYWGRGNPRYGRHDWLISIRDLARYAGMSEGDVARRLAGKA